MAAYPEGKKRYASLLIAFLLMSSFALLFYQNLITGNSPKETGNDPNEISVEELLMEKARKDKGKSQEPEKFTFYKTLNKETVRPVVVEQKEEIKPVRTQEPENRKPEKQANNINDKNIEEELHRGNYSIQVASFSEFDLADKVARKLEGKGYKSFIVAGKLRSDETAYRVRIGKYTSLEEARSASNSINTKENFSSIVVKE